MAVGACAPVCVAPGRVVLARMIVLEADASGTIIASIRPFHPDIHDREFVDHREARAWVESLVAKLGWSFVDRTEPVT